MDTIMITLAQFFIDRKLLTKTSILEFSEDQSLLASGIIDSINILDLIAFIEEQFSVKIQDEELLPENFESFMAIKNLITSKDTHASSK